MKVKGHIKQGKKFPVAAYLLYIEYRNKDILSSEDNCVRVYL